MSELSAQARELGAARVIGLGTEALRRAVDGADFLGELRAQGLLDEVTLLTGEQEAALAIEASVRPAATEDFLVVVDVGGGSTELAWKHGSGEVGCRSLPLGSVRLTEALISRQPLGPGDLERLRQAVRLETESLSLGELGGRRLRVVAVAGTATTLAALDLGLETYSAGAVEGLERSTSVVSTWIERLAPMSVEARSALPGLEPGRADVIVAGLVVLEGVLELIARPSFSVSGRGVRHGAVLRLLEGRRLV